MKKHLLSFAFAISIIGLQAQNVTTIYGNGTEGTIVPATSSLASATFNAPSALVFDGNNRIWVVEKGGNRIRLIDVSLGQAIARAGNLGSGAGSLNGTGVLAKFNTPRAIVIDGLGNYLISDEQNNCIRAVAPFQNVGTVQNVTTYAGFNSAGGGFKDTVKAFAEFNMPAGMIMDATGNIYVADAGNNAIRKISVSGMVTTIAGDGVAGYKDGHKDSARFANPMGLLLLDSNTLLVADQGNQVIRQINLTTAVVTTFAGDGINESDDGTLTTASFLAPTGLAKDNAGNIYVSEAFPGHMIRKISGNNVTTFAGKAETDGDVDGSGANARFNDPAYIYFHDSTLYVCDAGNHKIKRITLPVSNPTGLKSFTNHASVSVFPNPFSQSFIVDIDSDFTSYVIADLSGKTLANGELNKGRNTVDMHMLGSGIYFLCLKTTEGMQVMKIIKN